MGVISGSLIINIKIIAEQVKKELKILTEEKIIVENAFVF